MNVQEEVDIKALGLIDTYNYFVLEIEEDDAESKKVYQKARFGINIKFDIYYYVNGVIIEKHKAGYAIVMNKKVPLEDFWTELEQRNKIMKEYLVERIRPPAVSRPRGMDG